MDTCYSEFSQFREDWLATKEPERVLDVAAKVAVGDEAPCKWLVVVEPLWLPALVVVEWSTGAFAAIVVFVATEPFEATVEFVVIGATDVIVEYAPHSGFAGPWLD